MKLTSASYLHVDKRSQKWSNLLNPLKVSKRLNKCNGDHEEEGQKEKCHCSN